MVWYSHLFQNFPQFIAIHIVKGFGIVNKAEVDVFLLKSLLMKEKEDSENFDLKLNIQKTKIMASGSITSWQIEGETMETVTDFILGGGAPKSLQMVKLKDEITECLILKDVCSLEEKL